MLKVNNKNIKNSGNFSDNCEHKNTKTSGSFSDNSEHSATLF